jgi:hypothetical protein
MTRPRPFRGDRLNLQRSRWSDQSGNETAYLHVLEIDDEEAAFAHAEERVRRAEHR